MIKIDYIVHSSALDVWYVGAVKHGKTYFADYQSIALDNPHYTRHHEVTAP